MNFLPPRPLACQVAVLLLLAARATPAIAMEGGQSPYLKGYRDFMAGVMPAPGVIIRDDFYYYSGSERSQIPQGQLKIDGHFAADVFGVSVITPYQLFGGTYAVAVRGGFAHIDAEQTVVSARNGRASTRDGSLDALTDATVTPFALGWHAGNWHWIFNASMLAPIGNYDKNRVVNTGKHAWAFGPQLGITYFDRQSGWEFSATGMYVVSATNTDTDYRSGDILHLDFAAGKMLAPGFELGLVGYYAQQVTPDSGSGAIFGDRKERVIGLGPGVTYSFKLGDTFMNLVAKYYREFDAQNTTQGDAASLSLRIKF